MWRGAEGASMAGEAHRRAHGGVEPSTHEALHLASKHSDVLGYRYIPCCAQMPSSLHL